MASKILLTDVRHISAQVASADGNVMLYDRNVLAGGFDIAKVVSDVTKLQTLTFILDGLPINDRLQLLNHLLRPAKW